jgi:hypothetical protein
MDKLRFVPPAGVRRLLVSLALANDAPDVVRQHFPEVQTKEVEWIGGRYLLLVEEHEPWSDSTEELADRLHYLIKPESIHLHWRRSSRENKL